jgi:signal transduction histidine kinase
MQWLIARRSSIISIALIGSGLAICTWQADEHLRFERAAKEALIKRGRDITSTLGVVIRSQRRYGLLVVKERIEPSLQALVQSEELASIAILPVAGEPLASAGQPLDLAALEMRAGGVYWGDHTLTIMNLIDLGSGVPEEGARPAAAVVMTDEERRSLRPSYSRSPQGQGATNAEAPADAERDSVQAAPRQAPRAVFGRPSWMTQEQYDSVIKEKGVHSLVISMSTDEIHQKIRGDLLLRSMLGVLAVSAGLISSLAWSSFEKNVDLQIRLVKAVEMNAHLKEMSLAAAGLAHETRNPLNLIRGYAQMAAIEAESLPKLKGLASSIIEEVDRVTAQLNDFIAYSKPREARVAPVEIRQLVADVARTLLPDTEDKHVRLIQPETSCVVEADELLLRQVLFNVLLNALQAVGENGEIRIRVSQAGPREATLEIGDDGTGVPASQRENIFKPYVTMRPNGAGLGLAIVQQIVAVHRWRVECVANEPRGALFRFTGLKVVAPYS